MNEPSKMFNSHDYYNELNKRVSTITNIPLIVIICIIIVFFVFIVNLFSSSPTTPSPYEVGAQVPQEGSGTSLFGVFIVTGIVFFILLVGLKYLFNIDI